MAEIAVISSLESAKRKLKRNDFPFNDIPKDRPDLLWGDIITEYDLTLPEVSALKNVDDIYIEDIEFSLRF